MGHPPPRPRKPRRSTGAAERLRRTAYELFSRSGVRAVGVDTLIARAGVAKMTLYKNFASKDELALAFLRDREERWTRTWLEAGVERRTSSPRERLLAVFDLFDEWFQRPDFEACAFARTILEHDDPKHPVRRAAVRHTENIQSFIARWATDAGIRDAAAFAAQWHILMMGSIVAAYAGDLGAARRAKAVGRQFLAARLPSSGG